MDIYHPQVGGINLESVGAATRLLLNIALYVLLIRLTIGSAALRKLMLDVELNGRCMRTFLFKL